MATYAVPNGKRMIAFDLPDRLDVRVLETNQLPILQDPEAAIREAILNPIGTGRLANRVHPGQKVAIVVTDITRKLPEEIILPLLVEELLSGGIAEEDITVVVATGTHRPNTEDELVAMFGAEMVRRLRFVNHHAWEESGLIRLGHTKNGIPIAVNKQVAEADLRISTGVIETHLFAGYSGGVKSIAVGVAAAETIAGTHNYEVLKESHLGVIENNPFRDFLNEATAAVGLDFIVNVVQTGQKELVAVVAGDPDQAFGEGVKSARALVEVELDYPGDIVVTGVGYPKNRDLYQATRAANTTVFAPRSAVRKGGVIIVPASCEDGYGHPGYVEWMKAASGAEEIIERARTEGFDPGEQKAVILAWCLRQARMVITDCLIPAEDLKLLHLEAAVTVQQAIDQELQRKPDARVVIIPDALLALPIVRHD